MLETLIRIKKLADYPQAAQTRLDAHRLGRAPMTTDSTGSQPRSYPGVMVSSTFSDIPAHRAAAIRIIEERQMFARAMERDAAKLEDVIDSSLQMVHDSAAYIGVITHRYGQTPFCPDRNPEKLSLTELEFNEAQRVGRPILLFVMSEEHEGRKGDFEQDSTNRAKLDAFRDRAKLALPGGSVERVYSVFRDLAQFKEQASNAISGLAQAMATTSENVPQPQHRGEVRAINHHEPKPDLNGREVELQTTVEAILGGRNVLIGGGPGFGKTALAVAALYDDRVVESFGHRRVFISFEAASDARSILAYCVDAFGFTPANDEASLLVQLERALSNDSAVVILDNLETVFEGAPGEAERLLRLMAQNSGLRLVVTMRGVLPSISNAIVISNLGGLSIDAARRTFLSVGGSALSDDPYLGSLLGVLEGHALSIQLVAAQAAGTSSLEGLQARWEDERANILRKPDEAEGRLTSVRASLSLSLKSSLLKRSPLAKRLLAILSYLPGGVDRAASASLLGDLGTVSKSRALEAIEIIEKLKLIERRIDSRLRMLTPLRESVKLDIHLSSKDCSRLVKRFLDVAAKGDLAGTGRWKEVENEISIEVDNLDSICELAIRSDPDSDLTYRGLRGLAESFRFTGIGSIGAVGKAVLIYVKRGRHKKASILQSELSTIYFDRMEEDLAESYARQAYESALRATSNAAEAQALAGLGRIAEGRSSRADAINYYSRAFKLFAACNDIFGQISTLTNLGIVESWTDIDRGRATLTKARELARIKDYELGFMHAASILAEIIGEGQDEYIPPAIETYRRVGAAGSLAGRLRAYGEHKINQGDMEAAALILSEAMYIARERGAVEEEAASLIHRGRALYLSGEYAAGEQEIESGFTLWFRSVPPSDPTLRGWRAVHESLLATSQSQMESAAEKARESWHSIGRFDLIRNWVEKALKLHQAAMIKR